MTISEFNCLSIRLSDFLYNDYGYNDCCLNNKFVEFVMNGTYNIFCKCVVAYNVFNLCNTDLVTDDFIELSFNYEKYLNIDFDIVTIAICYLFYYRIRQKNYRLRKRIENLFSNYDNLIFVTLTFADSVLSSTSSDTRRKYVQRFLKSTCNEYVANIDFGFDDNYTHREHYHAICTNDIDFSKWHYGIINFKRINVKNAGALTHYINKLTNHAYKLSTRLNTRLIYSRCSSNTN